MTYLLYPVIIPMVGHNVVFRISLHMPIVMVMTTVLLLSGMVTMGITRTIKKMRTQVMITTKSVSIDTDCAHRTSLRAVC